MTEKDEVIELVHTWWGRKPWFAPVQLRKAMKLPPQDPFKSPCLRDLDFETYRFMLEVRPNLYRKRNQKDRKKHKAFMKRKKRRGW
jgi:hypothetical protein